VSLENKFRKKYQSEYNGPQKGSGLVLRKFTPSPKYFASSPIPISIHSSISLVKINPITQMIKMPKIM
jgi:hypothetical protein